MDRLLAEDLLLLCWEDEKGAVHRRCSTTLAPGLAGALLLDALSRGALEVQDGRARSTGADASDPLLAEMVGRTQARRRPPKLEKLVQRAGKQALVRSLRDRLVANGVLRPERRRMLGVFPVTRYPVSDVGRAQAVRQSTRTLLTGAREPQDAAPQEMLLAGLAGPTKAVDVLVERKQRKPAHKRAKSLGEGHGIPDAVGEVVRETQAATMAAVSAAAAASASSSGSS